MRSDVKTDNHLWSIYLSYIVRDCLQINELDIKSRLVLSVQAWCDKEAYSATRMDINTFLKYVYRIVFLYRNYKESSKNWHCLKICVIVIVICVIDLIFSESKQAFSEEG